VGRDFELSGYRAPSGWNFTFRAYNLVPFSAPIWGYVRTGYIVGVQKLFEERSASPFDKGPTGCTLLDVYVPKLFLTIFLLEVYITNTEQFAAKRSQLEMCRLLINEGADPNAIRFE
jgi:hypothetical protein